MASTICRISSSSLLRTLTGSQRNSQLSLPVKIGTPLAPVTKVLAGRADSVNDAHAYKSFANL